MKVYDLMDKKQMDMAYEAGKQLAKMIGNINLAPKQSTKKIGFGAYVQSTLPQPLQESSRNKQASFSHQLDILLNNLGKYEDEDFICISIDSLAIAGAYNADVLSYRLRISHQDQRIRYVYLLKDSTKINDHIKSIIDRINRIFDLGGRYF